MFGWIIKICSSKTIKRLLIHYLGYNFHRMDTNSDKIYRETQRQKSQPTMHQQIVIYGLYIAMINDTYFSQGILPKSINHKLLYDWQKLPFNQQNPPLNK